MARKENIVETLESRLTLPAISPEWTAEEQGIFLGVIVERLSELHATLGVDTVKAKATGVSVKGGGELEYGNKDGDWRDAILSVVSEAARVGAFCGSLKVDVSTIAERWCARRRTKNAERKRNEETANK